MHRGKFDYKLLFVTYGRTSTILSYNYIIHFIDFLPFGMIEGDSIGPRSVDGSTMRIPLDIPVVFNLKEYSNVIVSEMLSTKLL